MRTTVSNAIDVAGMMASVVGKEDAAKGQVFNCATDVRVSHAGVVGAVAKCLGKDPAEVMKKVKFYDPAKLKAKGVELPKGGKFPFRETHFGVGVDKAKQLLGWAPRTNLQDDCALLCRLQGSGQGHRRVLSRLGSGGHCQRVGSWWQT